MTDRCLTPTLTAASYLLVVCTKLPEMGSSAKANIYNDLLHVYYNCFQSLTKIARQVAVKAMVSTISLSHNAVGLAWDRRGTRLGQAGTNRIIPTKMLLRLCNKGR
jgi:hypothetical protein